jgi:DNA-binding transcriptional LysR family regulator
MTLAAEELHVTHSAVSRHIRTGRLIALFGFLESGHEYVALRRARRHRKSSPFCQWLHQEAVDFMAASGPS